MPDGAAADRARRWPTSCRATAGRRARSSDRSRSRRPASSTCALADAALVDVVAGGPGAAAAWGRVPAATPAAVNVEFVSANPTGPLHIGNARGAFVGDLLCRVLEAAGHAVTREYYFNDFGAQVRNLGASVVAIRRGEPIPEDGVPGRLRGRPGRGASRPTCWGGRSRRAPTAAWSIVGAVGVGARAGGHRGVAGAPRRPVRRVEERGLALPRRLGRRGPSNACEAAGALYEQDGALWFRSTAFGDDKDRVVRKSNGDCTYFGSDIGYVVEKFSRGFDHLVYIWGADHHGTVARVRNAAEAMGFDRDAVEMLLIAWVRFVRDGVEVSMSKRAGEFITLDELLDEIGVDAARWFFAARGHTSGIDFDIELAKKQSAENPVYYVQYAHARIASILRKAAEAGLGAGRCGRALARSPGTPEAALVRVARALPEVVEDAAAAQETHGVTAYATELATPFHAFYRDARVIDPAEPERPRRGSRWCARRSWRWPTRWRCWGCPRRSRCRAGAAGGSVGRRAAAAAPSGSPSGQRGRGQRRPGRQHRSRRAPPPRRRPGPDAPDAIRTTRAAPGTPTTAWWPRSRTRSRRRACPTSVRRTSAYGPVRAVDERVAVAAPAGRGGVAADPATGARHAARPQPRPDLELAQRVGGRRRSTRAPSRRRDRGASSGTVTGCSSAAYLSGWRICSVDVGEPREDAGPRPPTRPAPRSCSRT